MPCVLTPRLRSQAVLHSRKLHAMGWVANHDGNLSIRLTGNRLLITGTGISKADIDDDALVVVDFDGKVLEGRKKPFSELELHLCAYHARDDVGGVGCSGRWQRRDDGERRRGRRRNRSSGGRWRCSAFCLCFRCSGCSVKRK